MPRNSSGTYTLPAGNPVATNTLIETAWANPTMSDIGIGLTDSLDRFGRGSMLAALKITDGLVSAPGLAFGSEASTGIYRNGAGTWNLAILGVAAIVASAAAITVSKPVTFSGGMSFTGALLLENGTAPLPSLAFTSDPDTGVYRVAANILGIATLGASRFQVGTTQILSQIVHAFTDGTEALPGIAFSADPDTGVFRTGTNGLGLTTGGTSRFQVTTAAIASIVPHQFVDGTAAAPGVTFSTDTNLGLFRNTENELGIAAGGAGGSWFATQNNFSNAPVANAPNFAGVFPTLSITGGNASSQTTMGLARASANGTGPLFYFGKSRDGLGVYTTPVIAGDFLGDIRWSGADGASLGLSAFVRALASETFAPAARGSKLVFATGTAGTNSIDTRLDLDQSGAWFLGATHGRLGVIDGGASGATPNTTLDGIVLDANANTGISVLTPDASSGGLVFGSSVSNNKGGISYIGAVPEIRITSTIGDAVVRHSDTAVSYPIGFRNIPTLANNATAQAVGVGKVYLNTGNQTINTGVFSAGDVFAHYNNSAAANTLTQGAGVTLRLGGTTTTGSRTVAPRGWATVFAVSATEFVVTGAGVT